MPDGSENITADIWLNFHLNIVRDRIHASCPFYRDKFELSDGTLYNNYDDGRDILIRFAFLNMDIPQFEVVNSDTNNTVGNEIFFNSTTWIPYSSQNLFYEPIPYEFLYTIETEPQVIVSVEGVEAVCASLTCGFNYIDALSEVTGYSLSGNTLTVTGTAFTNDIESITLSNIACKSIQYVSDTELTCTITSVAGSSAPIVISKQGLIPNVFGDNIEVGLTMNSVSPNTNLNPYGGTKLTIVGENLPQSIKDGTVVTLIFSDGTPCDIESTNST